MRYHNKCKYLKRLHIFEEETDMDHKKVAETVIEAVGRDNLVAAAHCATRLRLVLKDDSKVDQNT